MKINRVNEILLFCVLLIFSNVDSARILNVVSKSFLKESEINEFIITYDLSKRSTISDALALVSLPNKEETDVIQNLSRKASEYSGKVSVGNPPQEFELVFDTGSANFIITSSKCENCKHRKYNSDLSKTSSKVEKLNKINSDYFTHSTIDHDEIFIRFGTGDVNCLMTRDSVCLGGLESSKKSPSTCVDKLLILEAIKESPIPFDSVQFDGIIGLSFTHLSLDKDSNFIDRLVAENKIKKKIFSFYFNNNDESLSQVHLGGINSTKFAGKVYFADVISKDYWEIKIDSISYGNKKLNICEEKLCTAIVDTGTSMIAGPTDFIQSLEKLSYVQPDCSNFDLLANLRFEINGMFFNLDPEFYTFKYKLQLTDRDYRCFNAYMTINALSNEKKVTLLLGIPFLKKYYTVFDRDNMRIGFAVANHMDNK